MFLDFVPLLLVNMAAGLLVLADFVWRGLDRPDQTGWSPAFLAVGLIATAFGGYMVLTWPLPGAFNIPYGELSVLFGVLFLAASLATARNWSLVPVTIYAFVAGGNAIVLGIRMWSLSLPPAAPLVTMIGLVVTGSAGIFALPVLQLKEYKSLRFLSAVVLVAMAGLWVFTAFGAHWMHLQMFKDRAAPPM